MKNLKKRIIGLIATMAIIISFSFQSDFFEIAKQIDIYTTLFKELNMYYIDEVNPSELTKDAIDNMLKELDPYTRYYDEQGVEDARIAATGQYGGIGVVSRMNENKLTIRELLRNSPAEKSGLKPGDEILQIDDIVVKDFKGEDISAFFNGLPNSIVTLKIKRQNQPLDFQIKREKINIKAVSYFAMLEGNIGYIPLLRFNEQAAAQVREAYLDLKDEGMEKLVIDVRGNPGGLLNEAVKIANFFLPRGELIVTTKGKTTSLSNTFTTRDEPIDLAIPLVILVDDRSASASEILAGALQDYDRAVVMGERSFGKGLVQRYRELSYGSQMKITISKYYTPSGRCIQELDYTNRKEDGSVPKFSDSGREAFKTAGGRTVYGGGGIMPDLKISKTARTSATETLLKSDAFFNYVTHYFYKNETIATPDKFQLERNDFDKLISFLKDNHDDFQTETERKITETMDKAKEENLDKGIIKNYDQFLSAVRAEKIKGLSTNENEILERLTEEIVKRYYYSEGVYQQKAVFDPAVTQAISVLNDEERFRKIFISE